MAARSIAIAMLASAAFAGCSTTPTSIAEESGLPAERRLLSEGIGDSAIIVVRDQGFMGAGCYFALYVNGQLAARMAPREMVQFRMPAGEALLGVGRDPQGQGLCSASLDGTLVQRETMLKAGETKRFRVALNASGAPDIMRAE